MPARRFAPWLVACAWLAYFGVLQWSVVRFRVAIVLTLTAVCGLLAWWLVTETRVRMGRRTMALALCGAAVVGLAVPLWSWLSDGWEWTARIALAIGALGAALALGRNRPGLAWVAAISAYVAASVIAITTDHRPKIDVWVILQQSSDALARFENFYTMTWTGSPGIKDAYTYLPWSTVLLAPGRWLFGDVRWMLLIWSLVLAAGIWQLSRPIGAPTRIAAAEGSVRSRAGGARSELRHRLLAATGAADARWATAAAICLILLPPGTLTQVDQAWTEPLLLTALVWWAVLVRSGRSWWAIVPLALACASKQHLALVLPLLLCWRSFGPARAIATGALTGVLIAPWFITAPADFVHDTITLLVGFHPIKFANTWYLLALNKFGVTLPFWITGLVILGTLAAGMIAVRRRQPPLGELLRWVALVLLAANLVNKQAFYNQFWLVAGLVAVSLVADAAAERDHGPQPRDQDVAAAFTPSPI